MTKRWLVALLVLIGLGFTAVSYAEMNSTQTAINCEPVLIYDVTGSTIAGPVHMHLSVYTDGMTSIASTMAIGGFRPAEVETTYVPVERVAPLVDELVAAGALDMVDRVDNVADMPMRTLTLLGSQLVVVPGPVSTTSEIHTYFGYLEGEVNTFNFYLDIPRISDIVDAFIDGTF